jgi:predicted NodU family carbamoyl transferase
VIVLGISALDKESTVAILRGGRLTFALSEERLTRDKQQGGFPRLSLRAALDFEGLEPRQIDAVAYPFLGASARRSSKSISLASTTLALTQGGASESMNRQLRRRVEGDWPAPRRCNRNAHLRLHPGGSEAPPQSTPASPRSSL